ncbi:hypothetical protein JCM10296v2_007827 [Rhodotorula toruloides]
MTRQKFFSDGINASRTIVDIPKPIHPIDGAAVDLNSRLHNKLQKLWLCPDGNFKFGKLNRAADEVQQGLGGEAQVLLEKELYKIIHVIAEKARLRFPDRIEIIHSNGEGEIGAFLAYEMAKVEGFEDSNLLSRASEGSSFYPPPVTTVSTSETLLTLEQAYTAARQYDAGEHDESETLAAVSVPAAPSRKGEIQLHSVDGDCLLGPAPEFVEAAFFVNNNQTLRCVVVSRNSALNGAYDAGKESLKSEINFGHPHLPQPLNSSQRSDLVAEATLFSEIGVGDFRCSRTRAGLGPIRHAQVYYASGGELDSTYKILLERDPNYGSHKAFKIMIFSHLVKVGMPPSAAASVTETVDELGLSSLKYGVYVVDHLEPARHATNPSDAVLWAAAVDLGIVPAGGVVAKKSQYRSAGNNQPSFAPPSATPASSSASTSVLPNDSTARTQVSEQTLLGTGVPGSPFGLPLLGSHWTESQREVRGFGKKAIELAKFAAASSEKGAMTLPYDDEEDEGEREEDLLELLQLKEKLEDQDLEEGLTCEPISVESRPETWQRRQERILEEDETDMREADYSICYAIKRATSARHQQFSRRLAQHRGPSNAKLQHGSTGVRRDISTEHETVGLALRLHGTKIRFGPIASFVTTDESIFAGDGLELDSLNLRLEAHEMDEEWHGRAETLHYSTFRRLVRYIARSLDYPIQGCATNRVRALLAYKSMWPFKPTTLHAIFGLPTFVDAPRPSFKGVLHLLHATSVTANEYNETSDAGGAQQPCVSSLPLDASAQPSASSSTTAPTALPVDSPSTPPMATASTVPPIKPDDSSASASIADRTTAYAVQLDPAALSPVPAPAAAPAAPAPLMPTRMPSSTSPGTARELVKKLNKTFPSTSSSTRTRFAKATAVALGFFSSAEMVAARWAAINVSGTVAGTPPDKVAAVRAKLTAFHGRYVPLPVLLDQLETLNLSRKRTSIEVFMTRLHRFLTAYSCGVEVDQVPEVIDRETSEKELGGNWGVAESSWLHGTTDTRVYWAESGKGPVDPEKAEQEEKEATGEAARQNALEAARRFLTLHVRDETIKHKAIVPHANAVGTPTSARLPDLFDLCRDRSPRAKEEALGGSVKKEMRKARWYLKWQPMARPYV